jgi:UDP-MurNAc hydroxylase
MKNPNITQIKFINHASIVIINDDISLLTDPWYFADAFHKGWNLLVEQTPDEISLIMEDITHIWISHEHPDHFSIGFFKKYKDLIKNQNITILFQQTKDKRVKSFFINNGFNFIEIEFNQSFALSANFKITCFKDGFYDSALFIETNDKKILNLNDCVIKTEKRAKEIYEITGDCDILLTQFSYAAWKGGSENSAWRKLAAKDKLDAIILQARVFKAKFVIPFASFIYFSNKYNFYLNDSINLPSHVIEILADSDSKAIIMKPFDVFDGKVSEKKLQTANFFWGEKFNSIHSLPLNNYEEIQIEELRDTFISYQKRVFDRNDKTFIKLIKIISPIKVFQPIVIKLEDIDQTISLDIFSSSLSLSKQSVDLVMHSESLKFLLNNTFGFDTLTVNGCFEEVNKNSFTKAVKSLAIENLNNIGIRFRPNIIFNISTIMTFLKRLGEVEKIMKKSIK